MMVSGFKKLVRVVCLLSLLSSLHTTAESEPKPQTTSTPNSKKEETSDANTAEAGDQAHNVAQDNYTRLLWDLESRMTVEYHKDVRPSGQSKLDVLVNFALLAVSKIDHTLGEITKTGILILAWKDTRLAWDPELHGGIVWIDSSNPSLYWTPRIESNSFYEPTPYHAMVYATGHIAVAYKIQEPTPCQFDMTNFPNDQQSCSTYITTMDSKIQFKAGTFVVYTLNGKLKTVYKDMGMDRAWNVTDLILETSSETLGQPVGIVNITVVLQRHSSYFHKIFTVPICFLMFIIPMLFLLPPDSPEKLTFGGLLMMMILYEAKNVESMFPPYTDTTPWLVKLVTAATVLIFLALLFVSVISSIERIGRGRPLPIFIKRYINGKVGPLLGVRENPEMNEAVHVNAMSTIDDNDKVGIVESEVTEEFSHDPNENTSNNALSNLVAELRFARSNRQKSEDWANFFTIVNRFLAILFLLMAFITMLNYI